MSEVPTTHPLAGTYEKLKRADKSIENLNSKIAAFFKSSEYPIISTTDDQEFLKAIDYHGRREIPIVFSVLAGEIVHHLRSCLDHVIWQLSDAAYRRDHATAIEFPVFEKEPIAKGEITRYDRKIKGISSTTARDTIRKVQPYNSADPLNDPLWIVHDMDRVDKHRELVMVFGIFNLRLPPELLQYAILHAQGKLPNGLVTPKIAAEIQQKSKVTPQIAFVEFGKRDRQFVVPGLFQLAKYVRDVVLMFVGEFS